MLRHSSLACSTSRYLLLKSTIKLISHASSSLFTSSALPSSALVNMTSTPVPSRSDAVVQARYAQQVLEALSPGAEGHWRDIFTAYVVPYLAPAETRVRRRMHRVFGQLRRAFRRKHDPITALKKLRWKRGTTTAKRLLRHRLAFCHIHDELETHCCEPDQAGSSDDSDDEDWEPLVKRRRVECTRSPVLPSAVRTRAKSYKRVVDRYAYAEQARWDVSDAGFKALQCDGCEHRVKEYQWQQLDEARRILSMQREEEAPIFVDPNCFACENEY